MKQKNFKAKSIFQKLNASTLKDIKERKSRHRVGCVCDKGRSKNNTKIHKLNPVTIASVIHQISEEKDLKNICNIHESV